MSTFPQFGEIIEEETIDTPQQPTQEFPQFGEVIEEEEKPSLISTLGDAIRPIPIFVANTIAATGGLPGDVEQFGRILMAKSMQEHGDEIPEGFLDPALPTSEQGRELLNYYTNNYLEPRTPLERMAAMGGQWAIPIVRGFRALMGSVKLGMAYQGMKELGFDEGSSMVGSVIFDMASKKVGPTAKQIKNFAKEVLKEKDLRNLAAKYNLSNEEIALLRSSQGRSVLGRFATKTEKVENTLESINKKVKDEIAKEIQESFPIAQGSSPQEMRDYAVSYLDDSMKSTGNFTIEESAINDLIGELSDIRESIAKTAGKSPDTKSILTYLDDTIRDLENAFQVDRELLQNSYQEINRAGNWNAIKGGRKRLGQAKESFVDAIRKEGAEGAQAAEQFETFNKMYGRSYELQEVQNIFNDILTDEGIDSKKLSNVLKNNEKRELLTDILGKESVENINSISRLGVKASEIENFMTKDVFQQALRAIGIKEDLGKIPLLVLGYATFGKIGLMTAAGTYVGGRLISEFYTNPKMQLIVKNLLKNIKTGNTKRAAIYTKQLLDKHNEEEKKILEEQESL